MNQMQKKIFASAALLLAGSMGAHSKSVVSHYQPRSQGTNSVREMVGWQELIHLCDEDQFYGAFAIAGEYSQTFRSERICECLFGDSVSCANDCGCVLNIAGSCVKTRSEHAWLADYFGLPTDFQSTVTFDPRIRNFVADLQFYVGLDEWAEGLYFRLNLPITHTRWDLNFCENVSEKGSNGHLAGYFTGDSNGVGRSLLRERAADFFSGNHKLDLGDDVAFQNLCCSRWAATECQCKPLTETGLADVEMVLGYNFLCDDDYVFGLNVRATAPTGNTPDGKYLFEPIVGNGNHWELGGGLNMQAVLWRAEEDDSTFSMYIDANVTHLFDACQWRCFDLCKQGGNSRYMLAQKLVKQTNNLGGTPSEEEETPTPSNFQFAKEFAPVANLTRTQVDVSSSVQGDVSVKFAYSADSGFNWDLGYNFWGRSCEKLCRKKNCKTSNNITEWALKGDAHVFGFNGDEAVALAATQGGNTAASLATIYNGTNFPGVDCEDENARAQAIRNLKIDNLQCARSNDTLLTAEPGDENSIRTSIQPVLLSEDDVSLAGTRGISHKVFTHFSYTWKDNEDWTPFLGVGASAEFASNDSCKTDCKDACETSCDPCPTKCDPCPTDCCDVKNDCLRCATSQWAVWVKGGVAFN